LANSLKVAFAFLKANEISNNMKNKINTLAIRAVGLGKYRNLIVCNGILIPRRQQCVRGLFHGDPDNMSTHLNGFFDTHVDVGGN